jgi:hypothetical protein
LVGIAFFQPDKNADAARAFSLLRTRGDRPDRRAANKTNEFPSPHIQPALMDAA